MILVSFFFCRLSLLSQVKESKVLFFINSWSVLYRSVSWRSVVFRIFFFSLSCNTKCTYPDYLGLSRPEV